MRTILERRLDCVRENEYAWSMLFRDHSGDEEIQAVRRWVSLRAREVLAEFIAPRAQDTMLRDQIEPTAELLTSGLAGLALWWIDHPELAKPVLVEGTARVSGPAVRSRAQSVGVNMSASPRSVGSPPGGASMVTSVASASSST